MKLKLEPLRHGRQFGNPVMTLSLGKKINTQKHNFIAKCNVFTIISISWLKTISYGLIATRWQET